MRGDARRDHARLLRRRAAARLLGGADPGRAARAGLTNAQLGLALFAMSLGALVAMPLAGRLCERVGSRAVTLAALLLGVAARSCSHVARDRPGRARRGARSAFGAGFGAINVAANAQGLALERLLRRARSSPRSTPRSAPAGSPAPALGALAAAAAIAPRAHFGVARGSPSPPVALRPARLLLPPDARRRPGRADARPAAAGAARARRGGVLHAARRGRRRRLERRLPLALARRRRPAWPRSATPPSRSR